MKWRESRPVIPESANNRWQQLERIFHAALDLAAEDRTAFIARECGGDVVLRQEIESLLVYEPDAAEFLETPGCATPPAGSQASTLTRGRIARSIDYLLRPRVLQAALVIPLILLTISIVRNPDRTIAEIVQSHTVYLVWIAAAALGLWYRKN